MTIAEQDATLQAQIAALLETWDTLRESSEAREAAKQRLRSIADLLADDGHLASLDSNEERLAALQSLLDQSALVEEDGSYATVQQASELIATQNEQLAEAKGVVATFKERLATYKQENRQLTEQLEKLQELEGDYRTLTDERDTLQQQLAAIEAEVGEENQKQVATAKELSTAKGRITKLEKKLAAKNDEVATLKTELKSAATEAAAMTATLDRRRKGLTDASQRIERLEAELETEQGNRQTAEQQADEFEQQLNQTRSHLEELESDSKKAIDRAVAEERRKLTDRTNRPPAIWIALTLVGAAAIWLALRATVGLLDGSWIASTFWANHIDPNPFTSTHFWILALVSTCGVALYAADEWEEWGVGSYLALPLAGALLTLPYLFVPLGALSFFTDAEVLSPAECLNELGGTSLGVGWACDVDAGVGERSGRLEVVAYTDDELACQVEAAAYLGMDRGVLAELSPPLRVRLLPGLPGRPRPCVVGASDANHFAGFFGGTSSPRGACYSSRLYDPSLSSVAARVDCDSPWRFQTLGSITVRDVQQVGASASARAALCTQRFGGDLELDEWRLVGRLQGERMVCAASRADGTTHVGDLSEDG